MSTHSVSDATESTVAVNARSRANEKTFRQIRSVQACGDMSSWLRDRFGDLADATLSCDAEGDPIRSQEKTVTRVQNLLKAELREDRKPKYSGFDCAWTHPASPVEYMQGGAWSCGLDAPACLKRLKKRITALAASDTHALLRELNGHLRFIESPMQFCPVPSAVAGTVKPAVASWAHSPLMYRDVTSVTVSDRFGSPWFTLTMRTSAEEAHPAKDSLQGSASTKPDRVRSFSVSFTMHKINGRGHGVGVEKKIIACTLDSWQATMETVCCELMEKMFSIDLRIGSPWKMSSIVTHKRSHYNRIHDFIDDYGAGDVEYYRVAYGYLVRLRMEREAQSAYAGICARFMEATDNAANFVGDNFWKAPKPVRTRKSAKSVKAV
jgi:hypothetical protein